MSGGDGLLMKREVNVLTLPGSSESDLAAMRAALAAMRAALAVMQADLAVLKTTGNPVTALPGTVQADIAAMKGKIDTLQADTALIKADVAAAQDDLALIKAQNQTVKPATHTFTIGAAETAATSPITYNGPVKHLLLVFPNTTNGVTATVTLEDASGRVLWASAAKADNQNYKLEAEAEWLAIGDQYVHNALIWRVTLSGVPGDEVVVLLIPRYYGV